LFFFCFHSRGEGSPPTRPREHLLVTNESLREIEGRRGKGITSIQKKQGGEERRREHEGGGKQAVTRPSPDETTLSTEQQR